MKIHSLSKFHREVYPSQIIQRSAHPLVDHLDDLKGESIEGCNFKLPMCANSFSFLQSLSREFSPQGSVN